MYFSTQSVYFICILFADPLVFSILGAERLDPQLLFSNWKRVALDVLRLKDAAAAEGVLRELAAAEPSSGAAVSISTRILGLHHAGRG